MKTGCFLIPKNEAFRSFTEKLPKQVLIIAIFISDNQIVMKNIRAVLIAGFLFVINISVYSQQEFMITQYMYNGLALNPAYAGVHDAISMSALTRHQWVGIEGAPTTQLVSVHSPLKFKQISLGALFYRDAIGVKKEHSAYFSYAYRIKITPKIKLSLGIQANLHQINQEYRSGAADDPNDPVLINDNSMKFNAGSGFLLHSDRFYVGFSVPQMMKTKFGSQELAVGRLVQHYYATAGYVIDFKNGIIVKPNILYKDVNNAPAQLDLNFNVLLKNVLWVGLNHRWKESNALLLALQVGPQLQVGYSFDLNHTDLHSTSHELMLNYVVNINPQVMLTPRFF